MRVLQIHNRYRQFGGEDVVAAQQFQLLQAAGHRVESWWPQNAPGPTATLALAGSLWNPRTAQRVERLVERFRPDIAHIHNTWFTVSPSAVTTLRRLGVPVVLSLHNYRLVCAAATLFRDGAPCEDCLGSHPWHAVRHRCYRGSVIQSAIAAGGIARQKSRRTWYDDVDRFLALSDFARERFIAGGLPADRISVTANSVDDPGPRAQPPSASDVVLFVGRLSEPKGVHVLLDAWARAAPPLRLVIAGTGPLEASLRQSAPASVTFTGLLSHEATRDLMLEARALVLPSVWYEGQPLVLLESAAAGLPVLLSDLGAMSGLLAPDAEALLFPAGSADALSARLTSLLDDRSVDQLGTFVRSRFEQRFTHADALHRLETLYTAVRAQAAFG